MINAANLLNSEERGDFGEGSFFCTEAVVARNDDPEKRCRVQCLIPIIDENETYQIWARRFQLYVGDSGFGDYFVPEVGTEVLLIGRLGDTNNLFYAPLFNETHLTPPELSNDVLGLKVPNDLKVIAGELAKLHAKNIETIAQEVVRIMAEKVLIETDDELNIDSPKVTIEGNQIVIEGNVTIKGSSVKLFNRTVNPTGPAI
jgi:phage baseplate assembly protein gpV